MVKGRALPLKCIVIKCMAECPGLGICAIMNWPELSDAAC